MITPAARTTYIPSFTHVYSWLTLTTIYNILCNNHHSTSHIQLFSYCTIGEGTWKAIHCDVFSDRRTDEIPIHVDGTIPLQHTWAHQRVFKCGISIWHFTYKISYMIWNRIKIYVCSKMDVSAIYMSSLFILHLLFTQLHITLRHITSYSLMPQFTSPHPTFRQPLYSDCPSVSFILQFTEHVEATTRHEQRHHVIRHIGLCR